MQSSSGIFVDVLTLLNIGISTDVTWFCQQLCRVWTWWRMLDQDLPVSCPSLRTVSVLVPPGYCQTKRHQTKKAHGHKLLLEMDNSILICTLFYTLQGSSILYCIICQWLHWRMHIIFFMMS